MSADQRFEQTLASWLEHSAPTRLPERVLDATFERTRGRGQRVDWRTSLGRIHLTPSLAALGGAGVVVVVAAVALGSTFGRPAVGGPSPSGEVRSEFAGTWFSTSDADGGTQTMTVEVLADGVVEIVVTDTVATVCSGASSTMTGTGRLVDNTTLVIPEPVYACDDGSEPRTPSGPPLSEVLRNLSYVLDPRTDVLTVGPGSVWTRTVASAPSPDATISDTMWPQSSLEEVRQAQELADAGDPAYAWQVDPHLSSDEWWAHVREPGAEIVDRFLREELGWDQFLFNPYQPSEYPADSAIRRVVYLRCDPGGSNPLYPVAPEGHQEAPGAESCAPTIDDLHYEAVSLDLSQLERRGAGGIWVVSRWAMDEPFTQRDPNTAEAGATGLLKDFLEARVAGQGAEGFVQSRTTGSLAHDEVPLLYATTSGAPYERYEIERVSGPRWPYGEMEFIVRLFADGGRTVVEQPIGWRDMGGARVVLVHDATETTENGRPVEVSYAFFDGEVTVSAADPWEVFGMGGTPAETLTLGDEGTAAVVLVEDPLPVATGCQHGSQADDAASFAAGILANPDFEATSPVAVNVGGIDGLAIDVTPAPGVSVCPEPRVLTPGETWRAVGLDEGSRMRLYLLDAPEGSSMRVLAIAIVAPAARFDEVIAAAAPIVESVTFPVR